MKNTFTVQYQSSSDDQWYLLADNVQSYSSAVAYAKVEQQYHNVRILRVVLVLRKAK